MYPEAKANPTTPAGAWLGFLSKHLLNELRKYWQEYKPKEWLFPGQTQEKHIGYTAAREAFYKAKKKPV
jgi:hypothetical protein